MSVVDNAALPMAVFGIANQSTTINGKRALTPIMSDTGEEYVTAADVADRQAKSVLAAAVTKPVVVAGASDHEDEGYDVDDDVPLNRHACRPPTPTPSPTPGKHCRFCEDERPVLIHRRRSMHRASLLRSKRFGTLSAAALHQDDADTTAPQQLKARLVTVVAEYDARAPDAKKLDADRGQPIAVDTCTAAAAATAAASAADSDSDSEEEDAGCGMKTFQFCMECFGCTLM